MFSVLLVDDDVAALASLRSILGDAGYVVIEASSGRQALQRMPAAAPDLLIAEILMPDGDGIELITAVRRVRPDMPIIATSERRFMGALDLFDLAKKLGAGAALTKPLDAVSLLTAVANLLRGLPIRR